MAVLPIGYILNPLTYLSRPLRPKVQLLKVPAGARMDKEDDRKAGQSLSRTISKGGNLVTPRERFHMITIDNNGDSTTLALGGDYDNSNWLKSIEKWNPETETWSEEEAQLEERRSRFGLVGTPKSLICPSQ